MNFCLAYCLLLFSIQDNTYADPYGGYDHHARYIYFRDKASQDVSYLSTTQKTENSNNKANNFTLSLGIMATEVEDLRSRAKFHVNMMLAVFSYSIYRYLSIICNCFYNRP